ncbi:MAG: ABC transporter ATP-binding protein [Candidatus Micrarchaeota archaeon]|nr:ABC transporter ATP-binding protein [Candidatus Micrarchaeota archaeon]
MKVLEFEDVSYSLGGHKILERASFSIRKGDFVGMIGPNGAGKTTIVRLALGIIKQDSGRIALFGKSASEFAEWGKIGYVPQKAGFDQDFPASVFEVASMGRSAKMGLLQRFSEKDRKVVEEALGMAGVLHLSKRKIGSLSPGQQQRVLIARALACEPEFLVLDEPTVGVDAKAQHEFYSLLEALNCEGMTILLVSHDVGAVSRKANKIACVNASVKMHDAKEGIEEALACAYGEDFRRIPHHHD